jgi:hypothetical protein
LQGLESQLLLAAKWVDSPKNKFFGAVARLEPGLKEFSHPHYQRPQSRPLFRILPLISNYRWKKVLVRPLRRVAQIDMKPPPGWALPVVPEGDLQVLLPAVAAQHQPNAREDFMFVLSRGIEIPE